MLRHVEAEARMPGCFITTKGHPIQELPPRSRSSDAKARNCEGQKPAPAWMKAEAAAEEWEAEIWKVSPEDAVAVTRASKSGVEFGF